SSDILRLLLQADHGTMMSEASPEMPYSRNVSCAGLHATLPLSTNSSHGKSVKWPSRQASKKRTDKADGLMLPLALVQPSCRYSVLSGRHWSCLSRKTPESIVASVSQRGHRIQRGNGATGTPIAGAP